RTVVARRGPRGGAPSPGRGSPTPPHRRPAWSTPQPSTPASDASPAPRGGPVFRFLKRRWQGWKLRHQLPFNFYIHLIGIPLALLVAPVLLFVTEWYWALATFVGGYLLQWIGHLAEGNDLGEWAAIKRLLGLPYVGISPRWNPEARTRL